MAQQNKFEGIAAQLPEKSQIVIEFDAPGSAVFTVSLNQSQVTTGQLFALAGYFNWLANIEADRNMKAKMVEQQAKSIAVAGSNLGVLH